MFYIELPEVTVVTYTGLQGLVEAGIKVITAYEAPISNTHAAIYCKVRVLRRFMLSLP